MLRSDLNLLPVLQQVSGTIGQLKVDRLTVIGKGGGGEGGGSLAGQLVAANEQVKAAVGVDIGEALRTKLGQEARVPAPPVRRPPAAQPSQGNTPPQNFGAVTRPPPIR